MRALSIWQPWASLVAAGLKPVETRCWATSYRGTLLIHAARKWDLELKGLCRRDPFRAALARAGFDGPDLLPFGAIVAVGRLVDCRSTSGLEGLLPWVAGLPPEDREFGNFGPGRFGWFLDDVRPLAEPVPCVGHQGLWQPTVYVSGLVRAQLLGDSAHAV